MKEKRHTRCKKHKYFVRKVILYFGLPINGLHQAQTLTPWLRYMCWILTYERLVGISRTGCTCVNKRKQMRGLTARRTNRKYVGFVAQRREQSPPPRRETATELWSVLQSQSGIHCWAVKRHREQSASAQSGEQCAHGREAEVLSGARCMEAQSG